MSVSRRCFLKTATSAAAVGVAAPYMAPSPSQAAAEDSAMSDVVYKSVKWRMVQVDGSVLDKFALQKEVGFDGVELYSPGDWDIDEVTQASRQTGMPIHGAVQSVVRG